MATTPRREEWCERCLHPIDPGEFVVVEAYKLFGDFERKVYFHDRCFDSANPRYFDALKRSSDDDRVAFPIKAPSTRTVPRPTRSRGILARRLRGKRHRLGRRRRATVPTRNLLTIS
jgi:hypothetical protein